MSICKTEVHSIRRRIACERWRVAVDKMCRDCGVLATSHNSSLPPMNYAPRLSFGSS